MATIATALIGSPAWNTGVYGGLSSAAGVVVDVFVKRRNAALRGIAIQKARTRVHALNKILGPFFEEIYAMIADAEENPPEPTPLNEGDIKQALLAIGRLHGQLAEVISRLEVYARDRHSILFEPLESLRENDARTVDLAEWILDATCHSAQLDELFGEGIEDLKQGKTVPLAC